MEPITLGLLSLAVLTLFLISGMRIAYATAMCGFAGLWMLRGYDAAAMLSATTVYGHLTSYTLLVLPLFILMGYFAFYAGITRDLYWAARQWFGNMPGGLAIATVFGSAGFAAACGASTASAAVMGRVALPELKKYGYDMKVATGCVAAGGTLATMIPPSVLMVIYGFIAEESIGALLLAGILPGLLEAFSYVTMLYLRFWINPSLGPPIERVTMAEKFSSLKGVWGIVVLIILVMGSIYTGVATPTEAAGVAAFYAIPVGFLIYRGLTVKSFSNVLVETAVTTGVVMIMLFVVMILSRLFIFEGLPEIILDNLRSVSANPVIIMLMLNVFMIITGMLMDDVSGVLLSTPILLPVAVEIGVDPIHFAAILGVNLGMGNITPPTAPLLYLSTRIGKAKINETLMPTLILIAGAWLPALMITTYVPDVALWLPNTLIGN